MQGRVCGLGKIFVQRNFSAVCAVTMIHHNINSYAVQKLAMYNQEHIKINVAKCSGRVTQSNCLKQVYLLARRVRCIVIAIDSSCMTHMWSNVMH